MGSGVPGLLFQRARKSGGQGMRRRQRAAIADAQESPLATQRKGRLAVLSGRIGGCGIRRASDSPWHEGRNDGDQMFLASLTDRGATPALVKVLAFNEARLGVIAENIANISTPGYRAKQLDPRAFQGALKRALEARGGDWHKPFVVEDNRQVKTARNGFLEVTPSDRPIDNILFHDGTNISIEREMVDLAETGMAHELAATLLRNSFDGMRKAIRGTV